MSTIVHFADLHLDRPFRWARPTAARRRRQALRDVLGSIIDLALEVGADALFCGGDLYEHGMTAPDTGEVIRAEFERVAPIPVLVAPGNHDWIGPQSIYARTLWSSNVHIFRSRKLEPFELADGLTIWGAAHQVPANTAGFLDDFRVDRAGVNIGLFHGSLRSGLPFQDDGKQPHAPFDAEQIPDCGLQHAFVGHFHTPQDADWHTYPGNPEPLTFGEEGERGVVIAEIHGDGTIGRSRRDMAHSAVHDLSVDLTGCSSGQDVRQRVRAVLVGLTGHARVTLEGEVEPNVPVEISDLGSLAPDLDDLVMRLGRLTVAYDFEAIAKQVGTVRGRFVQDVLNDPALDDELRKRVVVTGLRALDGRSDLEVP